MLINVDHRPRLSMHFILPSLQKVVSKDHAKSRTNRINRKTKAKIAPRYAVPLSQVMLKMRQAKKRSCAEMASPKTRYDVPRILVCENRYRSRVITTRR